MAYGLQTFGADGSLWLDTSTRTGRIYGNRTIGGSIQGSVSLGELQNMGTPFAIYLTHRYQSNSDVNGSMSISAPVTNFLEFNGTRLDWNFLFANFVNPTVDIYYGAF